MESLSSASNYCGREKSERTTTWKMSHERNTSGASFITDFFLGGVAAALGKTAAAPIERANLAISYPIGATRSFFDPFRYMPNIIQEEGVLALWRGNVANIIRYSPVLALNFSFKDLFKRTMGEFKQPSSWLVSNFLAGSAAGAASLLLLHPVYQTRTTYYNTLHIRKGYAPKYNLAELLKKTYASEGVAGVYRGFTIACVGTTVYRGIYFGLYDSLKPVLLSGTFNDSFIASFMLGWGTTLTASLASYPIDRTRMHLQHLQKTDVNQSAMQAFADLLKRNGVKSLFNSVGVSMQRSLSGAGALACYDLLKRKLVSKPQK